MNPDDRLHGEIRNGTLTISGNAPSIKVDGGCLVVSDGPRPVLGDPDGTALPAKDRMVTLRFPRAECGPGGVLDRIIATRPDGFITLAAFKWMRETGIAFMQLDWHGEIIATVAPPALDRPAVRRAQALAAGEATGLTIMKAIISAKLKGQSQVARLMGGEAAAAHIERLAAEIPSMDDGARVLALEAAAASSYFSLWADLPIRFARRDKVPDHWQVFGSRRPSGSNRSRKAVTPATACLNYLHGILAGEMAFALTVAGLDPGIAVFHADRDGRPSLAYDAMEPIRPYVESWLLACLAETAFAKRDFGEETDGAIRLTRPLSTWFAMTAPLWRRAAETVAEWLADSFARIATAGRRGPELEEAIEAASFGLPVSETAGAVIQRAQALPLPPPLPHLPAPGRAYRSALAHAVVPRACHECGRALHPGGKTRFCSATCVGIYRAEMRKLIPIESKGPLMPAIAAIKVSDDGRRTRLSHKAIARYEWERANRVETLVQDDTRTAAERAGLQGWYDREMRPHLSVLRTIDIARTLDISRVYARKIGRGQQMPHPRHFAALAVLAGIEPPAGSGTPQV